MKLPIREVEYEFENEKKPLLFSIFQGRGKQKKVVEVDYAIEDEGVVFQESIFVEEEVISFDDSKQQTDNNQNKSQSEENQPFENSENEGSKEEVRSGLVRRFWNRFKSSPNLQSVFIITFFLMLSKVLGFLRSILILDRMDKVSSDLLIAASKVPEVITLVLVMGTIASSLLPMSTTIKEKYGEKKMVEFMNLFQIPLNVVMLLVTLLFYFYAEPILKLTTSPQYWDIFKSEGLVDGYVATAKILLLGPIIFALQAFFGVYLSIKKRFFVYSLAGVISNLGAIGGLLIAGNNGYLQTAKGMIIGTAVATFLYWLKSINLGFFYKINIFPIYKEFKQEFWQIWKIFVPRMFIISGSVVSGLLINLLTNAKGQVTSLEFAMAIQSIFFILITSLGTVIFPDLSGLWNQDGDKQKFWKSLKYYSENTVLLSVVGFVVTFLSVELIMWFISQFTSGQNTNDYIVYLTRVLTLGIIFQSLNEILVKYFYIRHRIWQPVIISVLALIVQVATTLLLDFKVEGMDVAVAVALGVAANFFVTSLVSIYLIMRDYNSQKLVNFEI